MNKMAFPIRKYRQKVKDQCDIYMEHMVLILLWPWRSTVPHWLGEIHACVQFAVTSTIKRTEVRPTFEELWNWLVEYKCQGGITLYSFIDNWNECGSTSKMPEPPRRDKSISEFVEILKKTLKEHLMLVASGSYSKQRADEILKQYLVYSQPEILK